MDLSLSLSLSRMTWKMKILTTAAFSVLLLGRSFNFCKWGALVLMVLGVALVSHASDPYHTEDIILYNVGFVIIILEVTTTRVPSALCRDRSSFYMLFEIGSGGGRSSVPPDTMTIPVARGMKETLAVI